MEESGKKSLDELIFDENLDLTKPEVFYTLSKIFEEGRGVEKNPAKAAELRKLAEETPDED